MPDVAAAIGQLNKPHWMLIDDVHIQCHFTDGFNCEKFFDFLVAVYKDIDSIEKSTIHVNQSCYIYMQTMNLIDFAPNSHGKQVPYFLGWILIPIGEISEQDVLQIDIKRGEVKKG